MSDDFWGEDFEAAPLAPISIEDPRCDTFLVKGSTSVPVVFGELGSGKTAADWVEENSKLWRELVHDFGALFLRGFSVETPEALGAVSDKIFTEAYSTKEHPRGVLGKRVVLPIDYPASLDLYWHNEDSFNKTWPETIAFACQKPAKKGGETTVVDGRSVWQALPEDVRERFSREGVSYTRRFVPGLGLSWNSVFDTDDPRVVEQRCAQDGITTRWVDGILETHSRRPAVQRDRADVPVWFAQVLHWHERCLEPSVREDLRATGSPFPRSVTYGDGSQIPDEVVDALIAASQASDLPIPWQEGDLVIVDNRRMAHGRRAYEGERKIMVSLGDPNTVPGSTDA